jgi:Zn-dependent M28 family amino/carboxypeptidase
MLEIARAFTAQPQAPARSMLFVAFTGEEKGEQGSEYFAAHPPVSGAIIADINMDMFLMLFPAKDLVALGGEHTSLGAIARDAAQSAGLTISPDPIPEEVRFIRSDQYSFVKEGIPAISLKTGSASADPAIDGDKVTKEWLRTIYHTPKDDMNQTFDWTTGVKYAQTNFLIAWAVANGTQRPKWVSGDFFGQKFGK